VLAFLGLALFRRGLYAGWLREDLVVLGVLLVVTAPSALVLAAPRDHLPMVPLLIVLAAMRGAATLLSVRRTESHEATPPSADDLHAAAHP